MHNRKTAIPDEDLLKVDWDYEVMDAFDIRAYLALYGRRTGKRTLWSRIRNGYYQKSFKMGRGYLVPRYEVEQDVHNIAYTGTQTPSRRSLPLAAIEAIDFENELLDAAGIQVFMETQHSAARFYELPTIYRWGATGKLQGSIRKSGITIMPRVLMAQWEPPVIGNPNFRK